MNNFPNFLMGSSAGAVGWLFIWSWQAFLLLGSVWLLLRIGRSRIPWVRHQVWLFSLVAVAALPIWTSVTRRFPIPQPDNRILNSVVEMPRSVTPLAFRSPTEKILYEDNPGAVSNITTPVRASSFGWSSLVWTVLFLTWLIGAVITLVRLCISWSTLQAMRVKAHLVTADELGCTDAYSRSLNAARARIGLSSDVHTPVLTGLFRPMILLPSDIAFWTTREERVAIIQHELAHVERLDHHINFFQSLLKSVFFFHPLVRYACHQLNMERELACDTRVLDLGAAPAAYADGILKVVERNIFPDAVHQPASFASRKKLERRIDMILKKEHLPMATRLWPFLVLPLGLILALIWLLTPERPVSANSTDGRKSLSAAQSLRGGELSTETATFNEGLIKSLAEAKAFDRLTEIIQSNPNVQIRRFALQCLSESEGDGSTAALVTLFDRINDRALKEELIRYLGDRKVFDKLIEIAASDKDLDFARQAAQRLSELEGDGSTAALVLLYQRSNVVSVKEMILNSLGERTESQPLKEISTTESDLGLRDAALKQLKRIERTSDSRDR